ncbi:MAG: DUF4433 domain-containing protein [Leptospiraceae bacterium]|nr:DUF4433 domain-containing protein [Leptospiraceae bacterium]MBL0262590.1 DUF4433 domain-containing protein [Leptospiraceae bacterium]
MAFDFNKIQLFRITHIQNIPHILQNGITHIKSENNNPEFITIGDGSLISRRNSFSIPNGKVLGDYIPFYFGVRMPMLYVIQNGYNGLQAVSADDIVYCVSTVGQIIEHKLDFLFTDGHATDSFSNFFNSQDISNLENIIDWQAVKSKYWNNDTDLDLKRRKEAEFLVASDIPVSAIVGFAVYNDNSKKKLLEFGISETVIKIKREFYF